MIQRACGSGLTHETMFEAGIGDFAGRENFNRNRTVESPVMGFVDDPIPPSPSFSTIR
jgi:hypothetical protein